MNTLTELYNQAMKEQSELKKALLVSENRFKELVKVWDNVDEFVRPLTALGANVSDKALELIKLGIEVKLNEHREPEVKAEASVDPYGYVAHGRFSFEKPSSQNGEINWIPVYREQVTANKAEVPEGFVLCDKSIIPEYVVDAGEKFLKKIGVNSFNEHTLALAVHTEMLLAYDSLPPLKDGAQ